MNMIGISRLKNFLLLIIFCFGFLSSSCLKLSRETGYVTFGANYHVINCITTVTIYVDGENIGTLSDYTDEIKACGLPENITKELVTGNHTYRVEISSPDGSGCIKEITGKFYLSQDECKKIFIDYYTLWNK